MIDRDPTNYHIGHIVIDNSIVDLLYEEGIDEKTFVAKVLNEKILKRKFLLLVAMHNKINRLASLENIIDKLHKKIEDELENMTKDELLEWYKISSSIYAHDSVQLRDILKDLVSSIKDDNTQAHS